MQSTFRVGIVGMGNVGATAAYAMLLDGTPTELVLVSRDLKKCEGEKIDLDHALPFLQSTTITATNDYARLAGVDLTVITAGAAQAPGETRLDLLKKNSAIFDDVIPKVKQANPDGLVLIVANPVDILTLHSYQLASWRPGQVFGSGTMLDTARFRFHLSQLFGVNSRSLHAYILGEHGDTSFPLLSSASVGGQPLTSFAQYSPEKVQHAFDLAKNAAYKIIAAKGATYYAIGAVIMTIMKAIYSDAQVVLPLSVPINNYLGESNISLSVPTILGRSGVQRILTITPNQLEQTQFTASAQALRQAYQSLT